MDEKYIAKIKAFTTPPPDVQTVLSVISLMLQRKDTSWVSIKSMVNDPGFITSLINFDVDNMPPELVL